MATVLQIVDASDTVLFDLNTSTGTGNVGTLKTAAGVGGTMDFGSPSLTTNVFKGTHSSQVTFARDELAEMKFKLRAWAADYDSLAAGVGELGRLLRNGGIIKWTPNGGSTRYIDFEPSPYPVLLGGVALELFQVISQFDTPAGVEITISRQPYMRGAELDPTVNILVNPTMLAGVGSDKSPDGWTWSSGTDITGTAPSAAHEAWTNNISTTSERYPYQTTAASTCAAGEVWTFSVYVKASANGIVRVAPALRFYEADGSTPVGDVQAGTLTAVTTSWQRFSVTSAAAGANTSRAQVLVSFQNLAATAVDIYYRNAQFERASAASTFRVGTQTVQNDPALTMGRVMPVWIEGNADAPVDVYLRDGTNGWRTAWMAARSRNNPGENGLVEYVNAHHLLCESGTPGGSAATYDDSTTASGSGNNTMKVDWVDGAVANGIRVVLTSTSSTLLEALRGGTWRMFLRAKMDAGDSPFDIEARWGYGDITNVTTTNATQSAVTLASGAYHELDMGYFVAPDVSASGLRVEIYAAKDSGTGNLIMDSLVFAPADNLAELTGPAATDTTNWVHASAEDLVVEEMDTSFQRVSTAWTTSGPVPFTLKPGLNNIYIQPNQYATYPKSLLASAPSVKIVYSPRYVV